ncbi:MAG: hypothetical protein ACOX6T_12030 [Myxococcales bacterium]|jgi:chromosome segregation ATPase
MRTPAAISAGLALLLAGSAAAAAKKADRVLGEVEALVREGARAEQAERCEVAFLKYRDAEELIDRIGDRARAAELEAIVTNKLDKLEPCYQACQPTERQRSLMGKARSFAAEGQVKRATQIAKRLLVGRNEKCEFWGEARAFLRTLPKQADEQDRDAVDPCEVGPQIAAELQATQEKTMHHLAELALLEDEKAAASHLQDLVALYRAIDETRTRLFELREEFVDCESVYAPLNANASSLREAFGRTQELIFTAYQRQVAGLSKKIRSFKKQLAEKDKQLAESKEKLAAHAAELERLKAQFDSLSEFNEELYNDLFQLVGSESITFATQVEGKRIEQPIEEIRALVQNQAEVLRALQMRYPEYFADGVNVEGLKRKKLVLEKLEQMLGKFAERGGKEKLGFERAMAEIDATVRMLDKTIEANQDAQGRPVAAAAQELPVVPIAVATGGLLVAGAGIWFSLRRRRP